MMTGFRTGVMPLCLVLVACAAAPHREQAETAPSNDRPQPAPAVPALVEAESVMGQWDVASFEGYRPQRLSGTVRAAFADFGPTGVSLRIECNYSGRAGTILDGRFVASKTNDGFQTAMGCGPEREARDSRYFTFFDKMPVVERIGPDRLRLSAEGSELILERPALRRLQYVPTPAEIQGSWQMVQLTRYLPEGGFAGIGLSELPGRIVIEGDRLTYSACPQYGLSFRFTANGMIEKAGGAELPVQTSGCRPLSSASPAPQLPAASEVLGLLHSGPLVEKTNEGSLLLSTDHLALLLTTAP